MNMNSIRRIERLNYVLGGILIVAAALLMTRASAFGVAVGVVLACANFSVVRRMVPGWMRVSATKGGGARGVLLVPKMMLLMGAIVLALMFLPITAEGLAIGFSIFFVSIVIETVRYMTSFSPQSDEAGAQSSEAGDSEM